MSRHSPRSADVYRLFDDNDDLLYIGVSNHVPARLLAHRKNHRFDGCEVARVETTRYPTRGEALDAEAAAIAAEHPRFNINHNWAPECWGCKRVLSEFATRSSFDEHRVLCEATS